jgi:uncharacterized SAM-binding protein YcdF (DUF218 family)
MSFFLTKFLPLFVYPAGLIFLLLAASLIWWKKRHLARFFVFLALLIVFLAGNRWISMSLVRSLESKFAPMNLPVSGDVIVVLGGGTEVPQYPRQMVELNGAGDRVTYAFWLYQQDVAPRIILSGGSAGWQGERATSPAEDMSSLLVMMGVPSSDLIEQPDSLNTEQDAQFSARIIRESGFQKVILVTSALHMPRSVQLFEKEGIKVIPAPVDFTVSDQEWHDLFSWRWENVMINLLPTSSNLKSTTSSMKEYIGMFVNNLPGMESD